MTSWSEAFAAQAASDLDVYEFLTVNPFPGNHRLHYLQMWLEKLCKAYLWMPQTGAPELRSKHNVIANVLPRLVAEHWNRIGVGKRSDMSFIRHLCREIDLLHPQVDDNDRRPDNVEYPWVGVSGIIEIPSQWKFPILRQLDSTPGRLLMKAAISLTRSPSQFIL